MSTQTLSQPPAYHWTGANQRRFLETLAQTGVVSLAAKAVAMSSQAAYEFRTRAAGRVFALGWLAAILLSRDRLVDDLMERAFMGQEEEMVRDPDNNRLVRKRIDNRLGMGMLGRLDRMVEAAAGVVAGQGDAFAQSARLVAGDFERFLDLVEREGGGAETGLFLATHADTQTSAFHYQLAENSVDLGEDSDDEHEALSDDVGVMPDGQLSPERLAAGLSVWWDEDAEEWRTDFPPPADFDGAETAQYGEDGYQRSLSTEEASIHDARYAIQERPYRTAADEARAAFFAPDAAVKTEMRRRAAKEKAEEKAMLKAAEKAKVALARLAEKRRRTDAKHTDEKAALLAKECAGQSDNTLEVKAADGPQWMEDHGIEPAHAPQRTPGPSGYRRIAMPQNPRPLFGIYGNKVPGRDSVW